MCTVQRHSMKKCEKAELYPSSSNFNFSARYLALKVLMDTDLQNSFKQLASCIIKGEKRAIVIMPLIFIMYRDTKFGFRQFVNIQCAACYEI